MNQSEPSVRAKTNRTTKATTPTSRSRGAKIPAAAISAALSVSAEQRRAMIAEAAYLKAAERGFSGGDPVADWLDSEREVDALLTRG
jgi:hypothetical protein